MTTSSFSLTDPLIQRDPPDAVIYDLSHPSHVTITLPTRSTWTSGLHWHASHVECLRVVRGTIKLVLGSSQTVHILSADNNNEIRIDRHVWHEWRRAEVDTGEDVVVIERTEPEDSEKAVFFWNLNGVILTAQKSLPCPPYIPRRVHKLFIQIWTVLSLFTIFYELDNFPVWLNVPRAFSKRGFIFREGTLGHTLLRNMDHVVTNLILFVVSRIFAKRMFGIVAVRQSFTPEEVRRRWVEKAGSKREKSG